MTNSSMIVQIVTWNDFGEGTVVEPTKEYGYRDLGIIQDYRRLFLDPKFPFHTNDLGLAIRLYHMRRLHAVKPATSAQLDAVFTNIVAGGLAEADYRLIEVESKRADNSKAETSRK